MAFALASVTGAVSKAIPGTSLNAHWHTIKDRVEVAYHRTELLEQRRELMNAWATFVLSEVATTHA